MVGWQIIKRGIVVKTDEMDLPTGHTGNLQVPQSLDNHDKKGKI